MSDALPLGRNWDDRATVRYPDPLIVATDPRFRPYLVPNTHVERLHTGARWSEGPVWFGDMRSLVWSDIPGDRLLRWDAETARTSVFRRSAGFPNGNTRDRDGRLVTCEQGSRRVTRTEHDGSITVLIDRFDGKRLNAPNDVVVRRDGSIWFTDPGYGISNWWEGAVAPFELPRRVYRLDPRTGAATVATEDFQRPNGLAFSPDERTLYVVDTAITDDPAGAATIHSFDVGDDGRLSNRRLFHDFADRTPGFADGIRVDQDGNLYAATGWADDAFAGVHVFAPDGVEIGRIHLPENCANVCFGGAKNSKLFMAASTSLYVVELRTQGIAPC